MPLVKPVKYDSLKGVLPGEDIIEQCIHCGMCLAVCPTYSITQNERSSPRGRIRLIKYVADGNLPITSLFAEEMNFCLDCQACETACPAGVKYGAMVEAARVEVDNAGMSNPIGRIIKRFCFRYIVGSKFGMKFAARLLYAYQNFGIQKLFHSTGFFKLISKNLEEIDKLAPRVSKTFSDKFIKEVMKPEGDVKYKTAFLSGCLMNVMFADINIDTVDVLLANGCEVVTPKDQVCCGSLQAHNGDFDTARMLMKKNIDIFDKYDFEFLVINSAGCGAFMKEYGHWMENDPQYSERAKKLSSKIKDITEFLVLIDNIEMKNNIEEIITYHDACHLAHTQKITKEPRNVLSSINGLEIKELEESSWCCGSAGIYNVIRYDDSMKILERKMENIKKTEAKIVVTGNPGCLQQIKYGAKKFNVDVEVVHPVTLVKKAVVEKGKSISDSRV
jgi:glycolate oxidase iron-sulfur subunit